MIYHVLALIIVGLEAGLFFTPMLRRRRLDRRYEEADHTPRWRPVPWPARKQATCCECVAATTDDHVLSIRRAGPGRWGG